MKRILRIGHRGAAGHAPENTLASIRKAIALGIDLAEVDVRRTSDGHLVLLHDACVDRTTNGNGAVGLMTLETIRTLDAGRGERIPTLEEALRTANGQIGLILELKENDQAERACPIVHQSAFTGSVIYASFMHDELLLVRETDPTAMTMTLFDQLPKNPVSAAEAAKATHVGLRHNTVTKPVVETFHAAGLQVFVYTVNNPRAIQTMRSFDVDGIVSDFPDRL